MSTIQNLFEQAQLAEAAYANLWNSATNTVITDKELVKAALIAEGMSEKQAAEFVLHWGVVDHIPNTINGFSATIFESKDNPGQYSLAIRGSTPDQFLVDFIIDAQLIVADGIAISQVIDMYNYWQRLNTPINGVRLD